MRRLKLRHEIERKWLENRIYGLETFKPEILPIETTSPTPLLSPRDRLLLYLAAPISPLPQSYSKSPRSPHPRSYGRLDKTAASLKTMQSLSKWRCVRLNDMTQPCSPPNCFVIGKARRSNTPKSFYPQKPRDRSTHTKSKIGPLPDVSETKYAREAEILARKWEEQLNSSSHSAFRLSKKSSRDYQSRPGSHGRVVGRAASPFL